MVLCKSEINFGKGQKITFKLMGEPGYQTLKINGNKCLQVNFANTYAGTAPPRLMLGDQGNLSPMSARALRKSWFSCGDAR